MLSRLAVLKLLSRNGLPSSRTSLFRLTKGSGFPAPREFKGRKAFWDEAEVATWLATRASARASSRGLSEAAIETELARVRDEIGSSRVSWIKRFVHWAATNSKSREEFDEVMQTVLLSNKIPERHYYHLSDYWRSCRSEWPVFPK